MRIDIPHIKSLHPEVQGKHYIYVYTVRWSPKNTIEIVCKSAEGVKSVLMQDDHKINKTISDVMKGRFEHRFYRHAFSDEKLRDAYLFGIPTIRRVYGPDIFRDIKSDDCEFFRL